MAGPKVKELEEKVAKLFNKEFGLMVADPLQIFWLNLGLKEGSKVITPAYLFDNYLNFGTKI